MTEQIYIICWRSKITGLEGRGSVGFGLKEAEAAIEIAERSAPELEHWLEEEKCTV